MSYSAGLFFFKPFHVVCQTTQPCPVHPPARQTNMEKHHLLSDPSIAKFMERKKIEKTFSGEKSRLDFPSETDIEY